MDKAKYLIIGAGPAALAAAQSIRKINQTATITLVTREETLPYSPAVLPYLISNELTETDLFLKGKEIIKEANLNLVCGKEVVEILHAANKVKYKSGECEAYDKLLIATGAGPQIPAIDKLEADNVYTFRTYGDFARLNKILGKKESIAIYGAGLVAVEAAEKLCLVGHDVTIIARSSLLRKYFSPKNVALIEKAFYQHGGKVITKNTLVSANKVQDKIELVLSGGGKLMVDRLLVATGVTANMVGNKEMALARGGIKADKYMKTSLPNVYVAGDIAAAPSFFDEENATCPILPEAINQGRVAGANMAGQEVEYKGWISGNQLRCFDESLFSIGITDLPAEAGYEVCEISEGNSFLKLIFKDKYLVGVEGVNMKFIHPGVFGYLIREQVPVKEYQKLLLSKPRETACWLMLKNRKNNRA
jgi:phenylglyoxylate dehydrogenase epsilon subunit